jgi:hypothetical protein
VQPESICHPATLLDPRTLPELAEQPVSVNVRTMQRGRNSLDVKTSGPARTLKRRGEAYMVSVIGAFERTAPGGRNAALNHTAWTLGRWVAVGALEQAEVEDELYAAAERNGLVDDDGQRQTWATIRSGLAAGMQQSARFK